MERYIHLVAGENIMTVESNFGKRTNEKGSPNALM